MAGEPDQGAFPSVQMLRATAARFGVPLKARLTKAEIVRALENDGIDARTGERVRPPQTPVGSQPVEGRPVGGASSLPGAARLPSSEHPSSEQRVGAVLMFLGAAAVFSSVALPWLRVRSVLGLEGTRAFYETWDAFRQVEDGVMGLVITWLPWIGLIFGGMIMAMSFRPQNIEREWLFLPIALAACIALFAISLSNNVEDVAPQLQARGLSAQVGWGPWVAIGGCGLAMLGMYLGSPDRDETKRA